MRSWGNAPRPFVTIAQLAPAILLAGVIAEGDEQLGPYDVQDQGLVVLQCQFEAARIVVDLG